MSVTTKEKIDLGQLLLDYNLVTEEQLKKAEEESQKERKERKDIGKILLDLKYVTDGAINYVLSSHLDIPYVHVSSQTVDSEAVRSIPRETLEKYQMIPIIRVNDELSLVMADPTDDEAIREAETITGCSVKVSIGLREEIMEVIDQIFKKELGQLPKPQGEVPIDTSGVVFVYHHMIEALNEGATQIYIEPASSQVRIRYRMADGFLKEKETQPLSLYPAICSRLKVVANMDTEKAGVFAQSNVLAKIGDKEIYLHISILPTLQGDCWMIKFLEKAKSSCLKLEGLGLPEKLLSEIKQAINQDSGLIIVTGPARSGRTTTAHSLLSEVDACKKKVITIEKAISYQNDEYSVMVSKGLSALEAAISQEPDLVMVEDMNQVNVLGACFNAALAGRLILGQMHYPDAFNLLDHLTGVFGNSLIASTLSMVIAQRKVRLLCNSCKEIHSPPVEHGLGDVSIYRAKGCEKCNFTGYAGEDYLYEVLILNRRLKEMLCQDKGLNKVEEEAAQNGFFGLKEILREKLLSGTISMEEVI